MGWTRGRRRIAYGPEVAKRRRQRWRLPVLVLASVIVMLVPRWLPALGRLTGAVILPLALLSLTIGLWYEARRPRLAKPAFAVATGCQRMIVFWVVTWLFSPILIGPAAELRLRPVIIALTDYQATHGRPAESLDDLDLEYLRRPHYQLNYTGGRQHWRLDEYGPMTLLMQRVTSYDSADGWSGFWD